MTLMDFSFDTLLFTLAILLVLVAVFAVGIALSAIVKVWLIQPEELREARRLQGPFRNIFRGRLAHVPDAMGDFRVVRGLVWNKRKKSYESQEALSSEAIRAVFPK